MGKNPNRSLENPKNNVTRKRKFLEFMEKVK